MERRQFMRGVLGAAAAVPATILLRESSAHEEFVGVGLEAPPGARGQQALNEQTLVSFLKRPSAHELIAAYVGDASDPQQIHTNKLILLALGRCESTQALEFLLDTVRCERHEPLRRVAAIQVYRFKRRVRLASEWASKWATLIGG